VVGISTNKYWFEYCCHRINIIGIKLLYEDIFKKRIDSLNNLQENDKVKLLDKIKDDISDAYSKEKINELHYMLLKDKLSNYEKK
jgi:hypothetical protein